MTGWHMTDIFTQVAATREGGAVRRCHAIPHNSLYNVAQHSYGAVSLLLLLNPEPSIQLIKAMQWHDVGERWLGDMPSPGKRLDPDLAEHYDRVEGQILRKLKLFPQLTSWEYEWLKGLDILELWLWCREEEALGNKNVTCMRKACERVLNELYDAHKLPPPIWDFFIKTHNSGEHQRLSDFFDEVAGELGEAGT